MVDGVRAPRRAARQGLQVMDVCRGQHGRGHRRHPQGAERVHRARGLRPPVPQVGERSPTDRNRRRAPPSMGNARSCIVITVAKRKRKTSYGPGCINLSVFFILYKYMESIEPLSKTGSKTSLLPTGQPEYLSVLDGE